MFELFFNVVIPIYSLPIALAREMFQNITVNGMTKTLTSTPRTTSCLNYFQRCNSNIFPTYCLGQGDVPKHHCQWYDKGTYINT